MSDPYSLPKRFNIAGPCNPDEHYMLDAVSRLPEALNLALEKSYFVIRAPRQSGKTTLLDTLTDDINAGGKYYALYCSLETLQGIEELKEGTTAVVDALRRAAQRSAIEAIRQSWPRDIYVSATTMVGETLELMCRALDKPLIVFFDEADCLSGQVLITFLRQLRDGYVNKRKAPFPSSISLIGMRDLRDFKAQVRPEEETLGSSSPFNIVTKALTLTNFTVEQVAELYQQHTEATGQVFEKGAVERAWYWCEGQPWLVNALARQIVEDDLARDYSKPVTAAHFEAAARTLIERNDVHLDYLLHWLKDPRVRDVVEPMLIGAKARVPLSGDETRFCLDLGLLRLDRENGLRPANRLYSEAIIHRLTYDIQFAIQDFLKNR
ncbi:MAG: AAA-like domain-containing protein [Methylobacteriaceae bacterium]|jgi:hypothetical protein|nr:AAA-like domain-containing protein [Methylobacteriaceae bacterium]